MYPFFHMFPCFLCLREDVLLSLGFSQRGCGRIGTAAAVHMMQRAPGPLEVILAGRSAERGAMAIEEVMGELTGLKEGLKEGHVVSFEQIDWQKPQKEKSLEKSLSLLDVDALLHTAGPFDGEPSVLQAALEQRVAVYVDVADPMSYLDAAEAMDETAQQADCMAVCSAGAFPGFSNILAVECAHRLREAGKEIQDLNFSYFTAGLGGSGPVNLLRLVLTILYLYIVIYSYLYICVFVQVIFI